LNWSSRGSDGADARSAEGATALLIRILISTASLWVAVQLVPGIRFEGEPAFLLAVALVFGILNAFIRPVLFLLSLPFLILTLGLFTFVINALMLWLTGIISGALDLGFIVRGFWAAFWGALVVTIVSTVLSVFVARESRRGLR
jgi:putative membrane protein